MVRGEWPGLYYSQIILVGVKMVLGMSNEI